MRSAILGTIVAAAFAALAAAVPGCGSQVSPAATCTGACDCTGSTCKCQAGQTCTLGPTGPDGGPLNADGGFAGDAGLPANITFDCQKNNTCNVTCGTDCTSHCANDTTCTGTCGTSCDTSCTAKSTCTLGTGDNSTVNCDGTSACTLTTGTGSTVSCNGGSTCTVTLKSSSTLQCLGTSVCDVSCPGGGCTVACGGDAACSCDLTGCTLDCSQGGRTAKECGGRLKCVRGGACP